MKNNQEDVAYERENSVGYGDGYHFYFDIDDDLIHAHGSAKSGKESIYVNDKLVTSKRSFRRKSCHTFKIANCNYEIEFYMANLSTGELHCTLIKNGTHVKTQKKSLKQYYHIANKRTLIWSAIIGAISGWSAMYYYLHYIQQ